MFVIIMLAVSARLFQLLSSEVWQSCQRLSLFLHLVDEIRTMDVLRAALSANKECFIPRYVGSVMDMVKLHSWEDFVSLPETSWKVKQPADDDNSRESATDTGISVHSVVSCLVINTKF